MADVAAESQIYFKILCESLTNVTLLLRHSVFSINAKVFYPLYLLLKQSTNMIKST